jgi:hypothetical protein
MCCRSCSRTLTGWLKSAHRSMYFAVPVVRREPRHHLDDCCFCVNYITGFSVQSKHKIEYRIKPSALRAVPHDDLMPVPEPLDENTLESEPESVETLPEVGTNTREDQDFSAYSIIQPHLITQAQLNVLLRVLKLPKTKAQLWIKS